MTISKRMNHQITIITIKDAIRIFELDVGMDLYFKYKSNLNELNYQVVLDELENLSGVGSARLLHYCFDSSPERFSAI